MNKRKTFIFSILLCTVSLLTLNIGTASFLYFDNSSTSSEDFEKNESEPVAFIEEDTSKTLYLDIEEAIDDANSMVKSGASAATIVVMPGSVVRLNQSKTLSSGVDLLLPYSLTNGDINKLATDVNAGNGYYPIRYMYGTSYEGTSQKPEGDYAAYAEYNAYSSDDFSDSSSTNISKYLSSSLIIEENVSLTISNNSQLVLFSQLGKAGSGISGFSSGYYSQVIMMEKSAINVKEGGILDCRGYIKEGFKENPAIDITDKSEITNDSVINNDGTIYSPFVIYDYAGGNATVAIYAKANECPFSSYDMPQIHPRIQNTSNGQINGRADVFTSYADLKIKKIYPQHNACVINFCGSKDGNIYRLDSVSSYLVSKYNPSTFFLDEEIGCYYGLTQSKFSAGRQSDNSGTTLLSFSGDVSTNYLTMNINAIGHDVPITTNGIFFPIGYNYTLQFTGGTVNFNNDIKFMPGSKLILSDVTLNVINKVIFYDKSFADIDSNIKYPLSESAICLTENAEINIQGNGAFCGYIQTSGNSTISNLTSNLNVTSIECSGGELSVSKIGELDILGGDYKKLIEFVTSGKWDNGVKEVIGKLCDGVQTVETISTIRADIDSENNITNLDADSVYIAEDGVSYFKVKEATLYNLNINFILSLTYYAALPWKSKSLTVKIDVYKDEMKSVLISSSQLSKERGALATGTYEESTTLPLSIPEGEKYYVEITTVASSNTSADTIIISKENKQAVEKVSNTAFYLDDLTTNYTVRVEG